MTNNFQCLGFDVKVWPWLGSYNVDNSGWERSEADYEVVCSKFKLKENEYGLLEIESNERFHEIQQFVARLQNSNLIAIEIDHRIIEIHDNRYGFDTSMKVLDLSDLLRRGFDICDVNGLFSVLYHPAVILERGAAHLFDCSEYVEALELAQLANFLDKGHSPFAVARVSTLK